MSSLRWKLCLASKGIVFEEEDFKFYSVFNWKPVQSLIWEKSFK